MSATYSIRIDALTETFAAQADAMAVQLCLPRAGEADFALQLGEQGWQLQELAEQAAGPVRVDFVGGALAHRRQFGGGAGQMIAKAVGILGAIRPRILDATAGLGRDAFVLACLGCEVQMIERHPLVALLLRDGLARALQDAQTAAIAARMPLMEGDAIELMRHWQGDPPQVIYLDPMFPQREKSALVKKEMRLFKPLVGGDLDAAHLLEAAFELASHRVVVKRPRKAPTISAQAPSYQLLGKANRFDVYTKQSLKQQELTAP